MSLKASEILKKYSLLTTVFVCSLFIPFLLYSIRGTPLHSLREPYEYPPMVKYSFSWPTITSFTSPNSNTLSQSEQAQIYKEIDRKFCGQDRCRFILPIAITEQESKAQLHFRQLAFLAGKIGRTIVLPNVHNSHLGSCLPHSFDFYYDHSWLNNNKEHFNYITMNNFKAWILARHYAGVVPTGQEVYVQGSHRDNLLKKIKNCFQDSFDFSGRSTVNYQVVDRQHQRNDINMTDIMMSLLGDEARQHEYLHRSNRGAAFGVRNDIDDNDASPPVDVINLFYDRRYKFIEDADATVPISYSKRWEKVADKISEELKPYVAIHWRMERLEPVSNLLPCAKDLIDKIQQLDNTNRHPNVFLLTDYPHLLNSTGARPESNSFYTKQLKPQHHKAVEYLYQHLNVSLTTIDDEKIHYNELPKDNWHLIPIDTRGDTNPTDRSILGIIDKLVAMRAQWFFAGRPGVCAKSSSFTGRISNSRSKAFKQGYEHIIDPLKTFDL